MKLKIERHWAMPSHKTFTIAPLKKLISEELGENYMDPFPHPFKQDAVKYLKNIPANSIDHLVFDPPYSSYQLKTKYENAGLSLDNKYNASYWSDCKKEIGRIVKEGGKVISFGWNSNGIGKKYGFKIYKIVLVAHGSYHNDTIATAEIKSPRSI
tara:strand:+ start:196 stop:660 length:465 start_codon:yes stop_codon:yes gene_type:complete